MALGESHTSGADRYGRHHGHDCYDYSSGAHKHNLSHFVK
jgi:hypothetical protein